LVDQLKAFGANFMGLAGTSILKHPLGIKAGVDAMLQAVEAFNAGKSVEEYAKGHEELRVALGM
ncbi:MAG: ribulose 1,5-bisphosphate carboxylase large subunit, partial [Planctomycetes bacterium]|nr:ribulose 1,5-bisphosphate carboxylase large subunit [Planctomycetota bacterium]